MMSVVEPALTSVISASIFSVPIFSASPLVPGCPDPKTSTPLILLLPPLVLGRGGGGGAIPPPSLPLPGFRVPKTLLISTLFTLFVLLVLGCRVGGGGGGDSFACPSLPGVSEAGVPPGDLLSPPAPGLGNDKTFAEVGLVNELPCLAWFGRLGAGGAGADWFLSELMFTRRLSAWERLDSKELRGGSSSAVVE